MATNSILKINELGQSVWYDNLSKDVLSSGELQKLIESGVSGLTSNPTIFKKAIADSSLYDQKIKELSSAGMGIEDLTEELMVADVAAAADLLRAVFDKSGGRDGHASIEVSPLLARDSAGTIEAAKRIWGKLNRPNIMIKIPGTPECLPAIRAVLALGINVNVTLLFSSQDYEQVVDEYLFALEDRVAKGLPIDQLASVASFFVSRVDAICDQRFAELVKSGAENNDNASTFFGKFAIENARDAYAAYLKLFGSARFKALKSKGAQVQRPLWASTGTKSPNLDPLLYVKELVGPDTVNTMPPQTLKALLGDNAENYSDKISSYQPGVVDIVSKLGLPVGAMLHKLQNDGVDSFALSYNELTQAVEQKAKNLS
jgi:transaldolase